MTNDEFAKHEERMPRVARASSPAVRRILRRTSDVGTRDFENDACRCLMCRAGRSARQARTPALPEAHRLSCLAHMLAEKMHK